MGAKKEMWWFLVCFLVHGVSGQQEACFGGGSVAGAAVGAFLGALLLVVAAYYLRKLYWKSRKEAGLRTSVNSGTPLSSLSKPCETATILLDEAGLRRHGGAGDIITTSSSLSKPRETATDFPDEAGHRRNGGNIITTSSPLSKPRETTTVHSDGKHLVFSSDPESVKDEFAFDNAGYQDERAKSQAWQHDAPTLPLGGKPGAMAAEFRPAKTASKDDLRERDKPPHQKVQLWARDFAGLGFRVEGGAREGVRVHSVLRSGPAAAVGLQPGDKIHSIKITLVGCVLEDAAQMLSLASPYPVELEVEGAPAGWRRAGNGSATRHPLLRSGSCGDVATLEREGRLLHPPRSPNTSHSNNSTLETKAKGIKKIITEKIITTTTLERAKKEKEKREASTLERENEKNVKLAKNRLSEGPILSKPERAKMRHSTGQEPQIILPENGISHMVEHSEVQKKEYDPKRGMKFGIRVLPPNIPDDGLVKQKSFENGDVSTENKAIDEPDRGKQAEVRHENEVDKTKPVVAKRREKSAPPVPNARNLNRMSEADSDTSSYSKGSEQSFLRNDINSSGIKRDENGIPQEIPQHMLEAAMYARSNRKSVSELDEKDKHDTRRDSDINKPKKTKGKAPSPPENEKNKTDESIVEQLKHMHQFLNNEKLHSSILHDSKSFLSESTSSYNTSTPKANKSKSGIDESINFSQDDIDDIVSKPFKKGSDSLNNFYEDSKSNLSSNLDVHSVVSLNNSEKGSTTIELNNSDITIHSSPTNETLQSISDEASLQDENERKATSLGDLSRFDNRGNRKPSQGTLERAQSLDISADDVEATEKVITPKRKAMSVVENTFFDSSNVDNIPDMIESETIIIKSKEPRLSLNLAKGSAMEGLSTFQRNRLKKGSEFGNLEDAIRKGSNSSLDSDRDENPLHKHKYYGMNIHHKESDLSKLGNNDIEPEETSDHHAKRIMDENMKVHFKLVSDFAKSTSDGSNMSSLDNEPKSDVMYTAHPVSTEFPSSLTMTYDTNIPDDVKVSRHTLVNSLERPKSEMMKKLLAKNPVLNVQNKSEELGNKDITKQDESKFSQPDIVNFKSVDQDDELDFVSNIRVGSNNNSLTYNKRKYEEIPAWSDKHKIEKQTNVVTITTERTESPKHDDTSRVNVKQFTKSIEIGDHKNQIPDVIEGISRHLKGEDHGDQKIVSTRTYFSEDPTSHIEVTTSEDPVQKKVTVNVAEDEFGNKIITQNVETLSTKYVTTKTEAPLQIEQVSFGIIKNPKDLDRLAMEEGENIKEIDEKILEEIKRQNPNMHFTTDEPAYSKTETIILNTNLDESEALALMDKLKNDPSFMSQKTSEELSQMGVRVIHNLEDEKEEDNRHVEVTKTRYSINPAKITTYDKCSEPAETKRQKSVNEKDQKSQANKNHITEIQVVTPRTEKLLKQKSDVTKSTIEKKTKHRTSSYCEPEMAYELDLSLVSDFIENESHQSAMQLADLKRQRDIKAKWKNEELQTTQRHSDFDLPRNSQIKFRTATYESPKGTIVTSTDLENKRQSQMDQLRSNFDESRSPGKPVISAKPSNIPVKMPERSPPPKQIASPSKIPIFMSQKSQSQENLSDKGLSLPRSPPPNLSGSSGNISVTSIKSSSRNPSGK